MMSQKWRQTDELPHDGALIVAMLREDYAVDDGDGRCDAPVILRAYGHKAKTTFGSFRVNVDDIVKWMTLNEFRAEGAS